jgi:hypothetical protein
MNANPTRNWKYLLVMLVVRGFYMPGALAISFSHIIEAGRLLGLTGWQAWTAPFFIDGFALIGMVMRGRTFDHATRRFGLRLQIAAGVGSLAANIAAGHTTGERLYGALVVVGLVVAELAGERVHVGKHTPAAAAAELLAAKRSAAAKKAAATRAANKAKAAAAKAEADERRAAAAERRRLDRQVAELEAMAAGYVPADAPVSPAPGEAAAYL